jgi:antitoxin VapB
MALNIKDPETYELAKALARETGESMTRAVAEAVRERLERVRRRRRPEARAEELLAIGRRCAKALKVRPLDHATLLYDDRGLPK